MTQNHNNPAGHPDGASESAFDNSIATRSLAALPAPRNDRSVVEPFWAERLTGYLRTRDGEELRYSALLPKGDGPFPTLLHFSGYAPSAMGGKSYLNGRDYYPRSIDKQFLDAGYAIIGVNRRATGCSTGNMFDVHHPLYGQDGYDSVEFAAAQPWSTGAVGMYGWSWAGMSQLWTAIAQPPHLKAIAPGLVIADPRADSYAPGGVPQPAMISNWPLSYVPMFWENIRDDAVAENDVRGLYQLEKNLKTLEEGSPGRLVLRHPNKDAYLEARAPARLAHKIQVPTLSLTAYQDEATTSRGGYYQWEVDPQLMWMIDTNGGHEMYMAETYRRQMLRFFDHFLKGAANGFENTPRLQIWQEAWLNPATERSTSICEDAFETAEPNFIVSRPTITPATEDVVFTLTSGGILSENGAPSTGSESFAYPVPSPSILAPEGWGPLDPRWREGSLAFTTPPLDRDLIPFGPASADLWICPDTATEADLQVTVTALLPDGQEMYIQRGWLRLSNRAIDPERSTSSRPVLLDDPEHYSPMIPGRPELARVEVNRFSTILRKGTRLRIWIETPGDTGMYKFSYSPVPTKLTIWHDASRISRFVMAVLTDEATEALPEKPQAILNQPCRKDPLTGC